MRTHYVDTNQDPEMTARVSVDVENGVVTMQGTISTARGIETTDITGCQFDVLMDAILVGDNPADAFYSHCR